MSQRIFLGHLRSALRGKNSARRGERCSSCMNSVVQAVNLPQAEFPAYTFLQFLPIKSEVSVLVEFLKQDHIVHS